MGLYTEEQQQEFVASMHETAQDTLNQLMEVFRLANFGDDEESLTALDRFADGYRAEGTVNDHNTRGYTVGLGTLLGDLMLKKYGGRWVVDKAYSIETRNADGATAHLFPFAPVSARLNGNIAVSIHHYFYFEAARTLGFAAPASGPLDKEAVLNKIRTNAATVANTYRSKGATFELTAASIATLDEYLERTVSPSTTVATKENLMNLIGSFLGECIAAKYGARWMVSDDGDVRMVLKAGGTTHFLNPFGKVEKRIENGPEDNLTAYFAGFIPHVLKASR